jgi:hypothetical protein
MAITIHVPVLKIIPPQVLPDQVITLGASVVEVLYNQDRALIAL